MKVNSHSSIQAIFILYETLSFSIVFRTTYLLLVPILSQNNPLHTITLYSRGAQNFFKILLNKRPLPILGNGLWATRLNITVSGTCNRVNSYMIF